MKSSQIRAAMLALLMAAPRFAVGGSAGITFSGVPSDVTLNYGTPIPPPANVTASGGCAAVSIPTNDLALYYSFDANEGTNVIDVSGNGLTGAIKGTASLLTNGLPGSGVGMKFTGDGTSYVDAGTSAATVILGAYTLAAWINPTSTSTSIRGIITKGANVNANSQDYGLAWDNGRIFFSSVNVTTTTNAILTDTNAAPLGAWTHVACTVDDAGTGRVYINGKLYTNVPMTAPQTDLPGARALYVGRWRSGYDFFGNLDEVRMYRRALTSNEVANLAGTSPAPVVTLTQTTNGTNPTVITRVWTAIDKCANEASATQRVAILSPPPPTLIGVPDDLVISTGQVVPPPASVQAKGLCGGPDTATNGLLLHYAFDSDFGTNVVDLSGNGFDGQLRGGATSGTGGYSNAGLLLNGTNGYLRQTSTNLSQELTVSLWVKEISRKSSGDPAFAHVIYSANPLVTGFDELSSNNGLLQFAMATGSTSWINTGVILPLATWTHVALVKTAPGALKLYLNGSLVYSNVVSTGLNQVLPISFGVWQHFTNTATLRGFFHGAMDEICVYDRALAPNEVLALTDSMHACDIPVALSETTNGICRRIVTRIWTAHDEFGQSVSATQNITVVDDVGPNLVGVPSNQTLFCGQAVPLVPDVTAVDESSEADVSLVVIATGSCPGTIIRTWTAVDTCGNATSAQQVITIRAYDTDRDGIPDEFETGTGHYVSHSDTGSNPDLPDSDADGFKDGDEVNHGSDPNDPNSIPRVVDLDFDGDLVSDIGVYYGPHRDWFVSMTMEGFTNWVFGGSPYLPAQADYDGDGRVEAAVVSPMLGQWANLKVGGTYSMVNFKRVPNGIPAVGDFDGDRKANRCIYDPTPGLWHFYSTNGTEQIQQFGYRKTIPVVGDFDGDGRDDKAIYDPKAGYWYISCSTEGFRQMQFGYTGAIPFVGDYDGDQKDDIGVYDPKIGRWYHQLSSEGFKTYVFGYKKTVPVVGDFDGDGKYDTSVYDPKTFTWYIFGTRTGYRSFKYGFPSVVPLGASK